MAATALAFAAGLVACESSQDKAKRLRESGSSAFSAKGLKVTKRSKDVKVEGKALFQDDNGVAVAVQLRNTSSKTLRNVPIAIDVRDAKNTSLFRNDDPGLEQSLTGIALLKPRQSVTWVNDQVFANGKAVKVKVKVGAAKAARARLPAIDVTPPKFEGDPVSGLSVTGKVRNRSKLLQKQLVLYGVARRGGKVVAAGRGGIERLRPGKRAGYQIFFIGNPRGAKVQLATPPTVLE